MACVDDKGQLSISAIQLLNSITEQSLSPSEISKALELPLFRVRSSLREMKGFKLIEEHKGRYIITQKGKQLLNKQVNS